MPALASIALLMTMFQEAPPAASIGPQRTPPPLGWVCTVRAEIAAGVAISMLQTLDSRDDRQGSRMMTLTLLRGGQMVWHRVAGSAPAGPPDLAVLPLMGQGKPDPDAMARIELDGRSFYLPAATTLIRLDGKEYGVRFQQPEVLEALWGAAHWRVSMLDRKGGETGAAEGSLPAREAVLARFARLLPDLEARMADVEKQCGTLGPDNDI